MITHMNEHDPRKVLQEAMAASESMWEHLQKTPISMFSSIYYAQQSSDVFLDGTMQQILKLIKNHEAMGAGFVIQTALSHFRSMTNDEKENQILDHFIVSSGAFDFLREQIGQTQKISHEEIAWAQNLSDEKIRRMMATMMKRYGRDSTSQTSEGAAMCDAPKNLYHKVFLVFSEFYREWTQKEGGGSYGRWKEVDLTPHLLAVVRAACTRADRTLITSAAYLSEACITIETGGDVHEGKPMGELVRERREGPHRDEPRSGKPSP